MLIPAMQSWFGYDVPTRERFQAIYAAGFRRVAPFWGESLCRADIAYGRQPALAAECGLGIDSFHYPFLDTNRLWLEGEETERLMKMLVNCIHDTARFGVASGVMHLTRTFEPPPFCENGLKRIARLVDEAEKYEVNLAFENLARNDYIDCVLTRLHSERIRICYDAGHEFAYSSVCDVPERYGKLISVVHFSDNFGVKDEHLLPFEGIVDWSSVMKRLRRCGYSGGFVIEASNDPTCCPKRGMEAFLADAFDAAKRLLLLYDEADA
jgi:sugar phosphate isomerase/epimerase